MKILYFAWLREHIGKGDEELDTLPENVGTVAQLADFLAARGDGYKAAFAERELIRAAVNQEYARPDTPVAPGDEVAFFPPVTGG